MGYERLFVANSLPEPNGVAVAVESLAWIVGQVGQQSEFSQRERSTLPTRVHDRTTRPRQRVRLEITSGCLCWITPYSHMHTPQSTRERETSSN